MAFSFGSISKKINQVASISNQIKAITAPTQAFTPANIRGGRFPNQLGSISSDFSNTMQGLRAGLPTEFNRNITSAANLVDGFNGMSNGTIGPALGTIQNLAGTTFQNQVKVASQLNGISDFAQNLNVNLDPNQLKNITSAELTNVASSVTNAFSRNVKSLSGGVRKAFTGNLQDLQNLTNVLDVNDITKTIIQTVPFDTTDIVSSLGERYAPLRALRESVGDLSNIDQQFIDNEYKSPFGQYGRAQDILTSGDSRSKLPNELREHNHYNYIITLGLLNIQQFNNPSLYRGNANFDQFIVKSSGGALNKRYQTNDEVGERSVGENGEVITQNPGHAEYYIDNVDLGAVLSPNSKTGPSLGTTISFSVTEPYSMGNFIQAVTGIARTNGYANYLDAPFALKIDFVGWDSEGAQDADFVGGAHWVPIKMTKMDFRVNGSGSTYNVEAVAYSETGLGDAVAKSKSPVKAKGDVVWKVCNEELDSIASTFNDRITALEENKVLVGGDRFLIAFPKDPDALVKTVESSAGGAAGFSERLVSNTIVEEELLPGSDQTPSDVGIEEPQEVQTTIRLNTTQKSALLQALTNFANDESQMNRLGLSNLRTNATAGTNTQQPSLQESTNEDGDTVVRSNIAGPDKAFDVFSFEKGERIDTMIEKVLLESEELKDLATAESENGTKEWFRIDTKVFIDNDPVATEQLGRPPRIYVFSVIPYFHDESKVQGPKEKPKNIEGFKKLALKEYNYIYTGKNEDVLDIDLQFNMAFMQTAFANFGNNGGAARAGAAGRMALQNDDEASMAKPTQNKANSEDREPGKEVAEINRPIVSSASRNFDVRQKIAEMFNNTLNYTSADMLTVEMTIWGDPFFIPQQTGNYTGKTVGNPNMTENGTVQYLTNQVYVILNFLTPFDYQVKGATMEMPRIVPEFSGVYIVTQVSNQFNQGQFKQVLTMYRKTGQADEPTDENKGVVVTEDDAAQQTDPQVSTGVYDDAILRAARRANNAQGNVNCDNIQSVPSNDEIIEAYEEDFSVVTPIVGNPRLPGAVGIGEDVYDPRNGIFPGQPQVSRTVSAAASDAAATARNLSNTYQDSVLRIANASRRLSST